MGAAGSAPEAGNCAKPAATNQTMYRTCVVFMVLQNTNHVLNPVKETPVAGLMIAVGDVAGA